VQKEKSYVWRNIATDRWLCVTEDDPATIVRGITKEGIRRYRIQLPCGAGKLCSGPVIFERFKTAEFSLKAKLGINSVRREMSALSACAK
jgi:hypothetical protein